MNTKTKTALFFSLLVVGTVSGIGASRAQQAVPTVPVPVRVAVPESAPRAATDGVAWVKGATPESLVVGNPIQGLPMNICRAKMLDGNMHVGVAWKGTCYVGFGGKSVNSAVAETLVAKTASWVAPKSATEIPADAVKVADLSGAPLHVCRAMDPTKNLRPGKAWKGNCYIAHGPQELKVPAYELLVVAAK